MRRVERKPCDCGESLRLSPRPFSLSGRREYTATTRIVQCYFDNADRFTPRAPPGRAGGYGGHPPSHEAGSRDAGADSVP